MVPLDPCIQCHTRKIVFDGIHWACFGCGLPIVSPVDVERQRIFSLLNQFVSQESAEWIMDPENSIGMTYEAPRPEETNTGGEEDGSLHAGDGPESDRDNQNDREISVNDPQVVQGSGLDT